MPLLGKATLWAQGLGEAWYKPLEPAQDKAVSLIT